MYESPSKHWVVVLQINEINHMRSKSERDQDVESIWSNTAGQQTQWNKKKHIWSMRWLGWPGQGTCKIPRQKRNACKYARAFMRFAASSGVSSTIASRLLVLLGLFFHDISIDRVKSKHTVLFAHIYHLLTYTHIAILPHTHTHTHDAPVDSHRACSNKRRQSHTHNTLTHTKQTIRETTTLHTY